MPQPPSGPDLYPPTVSLVRRLTREGPDPGPTTPADIEAWLLGPAIDEDDTAALIDRLAWRLWAAGLGVDRFSAHAGTLHPQAIGVAWNWSRATRTCDEIRVAPEAVAHDSFRRNPICGVIEHGEPFRGMIGDPAAKARFPIFEQFAGQGFTEYAAIPVGRDRGRHNAVTVATSRPGGFAPGALEAVERLVRIFALHLQRHVASRIARNIVRTYLGEEAGIRVLDGTISRGAGEIDEATIWMSDLRGFTTLSERLPPETMLALLDAYFDVMAEAVMAEGGEVLKFIGDGLLAAFGRRGGDPREPAASALRAARRALADLDRLNAAPPAPLARAEGWRPLATGIGLHFGRVFFGNVGAPARLDFTVIGRAVNLASRVEGLCRPLGRPILLTEAVARLLDEPLDDLGPQPVKGLAEPVRILAPRLRE